MIRALLAVARRLRPAATRECLMCARTVRRLTPAHHADIGSKRMPTCRRRGCTGQLWPVDRAAGWRRLVGAHIETEMNRAYEETPW